MSSVLDAVRHLPAQCRASQLALAIGVQPATIRTWARLKIFPRGYRHGRRMTLWSRDAVLAHLQAQQEAAADVRV
jgi:hypothetical protein